MDFATRNAGFTLIELVTAMTVAGVLSAVALPRMASLTQDARVAKIEAAHGAVIASANQFHTKWILSGAPAGETVIDGVGINGSGFPTAAGILVAAGVAEHYDTHLTGTIATDTQHPNCSLVYFPDTGTARLRTADGTGCS